MDTVEKIIKAKLREIENKYNVRVLYACESGSRAWGFASPNSDYDVRFIYVRPVEDYIGSILKSEHNTTITETSDELYDMVGLDIIKAAGLLYKSNQQIMEWVNSPIVYVRDDDFNGFADLVPKYFRLKESMYHYFNMMREDYEKYVVKSVSTVPAKAYCYMIREILCLNWLLQNETIPPVLFEDVLSIDRTDVFGRGLNKILEAKKSSDEVAEIKVSNDINNWIRTYYDFYSEYLIMIGRYKNNQSNQWDDLEQYLYSLLHVRRENDESL